MGLSLTAENQTASAVPVADLGVTVPASGQLVLTDTLALGVLWASVDLRAAVEADLLLFHDGERTLTRAQSLACLGGAMARPDGGSYNVYDSGGSQSFAGTVTVATDTERRPSPAFAVDGTGEVLSHDEGRYLVRAYCTILGGGSARQQVSAWLELNGVEVPGTRSELYRRNQTSGSTGTMEAELDLQAGDRVRMRAQAGGPGAVQMRAGGSSLIFERVA
jgi:hypothetical protein